MKSTLCGKGVLLSVRLEGKIKKSSQCTHFLFSFERHYTSDRPKHFLFHEATFVRHISDHCRSQKITLEREGGRRERGRKEEREGGGREERERGREEREGGRRERGRERERRGGGGGRERGEWERGRVGKR